VKIIIDSARQRHRRRLAADGGRLTQVWGQQAVIVNQPGAGGSIAVRAASQAAPTGTRPMWERPRRSPRSRAHRAYAQSADRAAARFRRSDSSQQPMFIAVAPQIGVGRRRS
jgi:hypothetical protein